MRTFLYFPIILSFFLSTINSQAQISGTHWVNSDGTGDYITLAEMANDLNAQGISGDVVIKIAAGAYLDQIALEIPSATGSNTLTIEGETGNPDDVTISFTEATDSTPYVFRFVAMENVTVRNLTFNTVGSNNGTIIDIRQNSENFNIDNNKFYGDNNGTGVFFGSGLDFSEIYAVMNNLTVTNNYFTLLSPSVGSQQWAFEKHNNITVSDNVFHDADAVRFNSVDNVTITNNYSYGTEYVVFGFKLTHGKGGLIENNVMNDGYESIYLFVDSSTVAQPFIVRNNFVSGSRDLLSALSCNGLNILNNSFRSDDDDYVVLNCNSNLNTTIANNIFYQANQEGGFYLENPFFGTTQNYQYNAWYSEGGIVGILDTVTFQIDYDMSFEDFLTLENVDESNIYAQPVFESDSNLHVASSLLKVGLPTDLVMFDIDGDQRDPLLPTIGADEIESGLLIGGLKLDTVQILSPASDGLGLQFSYDISNLSSFTIYGPREDKIWLSVDTVLDPFDILLDSTMVSNNLLANETFIHQLITTIPLGEFGLRHLIVEIDSDEQLFDDNIDNVKASAAFEILISSRPDLVVSNIEVPVNPFSGTQVTIEWTVTNQGDAPAVLGWTDKIYLDSDSTNFENPFDINENAMVWVGSRLSPSALLPGESYTASKNINLPIDLGGEHYFLILTDYNNSVPETPFESNNFKQSPEMFVLQSPLPDLVITDVNIPLTSFAGESIDINYTVLNNGEADVVPQALPFNYFYGYTWAPLLAYQWIDYIYLEDSVVLDNPSNYLSVTGYQFEDLVPGDSYVITQSVNLPECIYGNHYVHLYTDRWNLIQEAAESNNVWITDSIEIVLNPNPDLEVMEISNNTDQPFSGQELSLTFNIKNNGPADLIFSENNWFDHVYLSPTANLQPNDLISIGTFSYNQDVLANDTYTADANFVLPQDQIGDMFLVVYSDANNNICEIPFEENNFDFYPINISLTPSPDLEITNWEMVEEINAGELLDMNFEIENTGNGPTVSGSWHDDVTIVAQGASLYTGIQLDTHLQEENLDAGSTYSWTSITQIPADLAEGVYEVYYQLDEGEDEFEYESEENNIQVMILNVTHDENNVSDLEAVSLEIIGEAFSGQTIALNYEVYNSSLETDVLGWYDEISIENQYGVTLGVGTQLHIGDLANGDSYTNTMEFLIPNGLDGEYILKLTVDTSNAVLEYDLANNIFTTEISINLSPSANLSPTVLNIPEAVSAGQSFSVDYIAVNFGQIPVEDVSWKDRVYFSLDNLLDAGDIYVGQFDIAEDVDALEAYTVDSLVQVPITLLGDYFVIVEIDATDNIYEHMNEDDNYIVSEDPITVDLAPPIEFHVVFEPMQDILNTYATVNATFTNTSSNVAEGSWVHRTYLSEDELWDIADVQVGYLPIGGSILNVPTPIGPGESYVDDVVSTLPYVKAGNYHIIVRCDIFNNMHELDEYNNDFVSPTVFIDNIPLIEPDVVYDEEFYNLGRDYFKIDVPMEMGMLVKMRHVEVPGLWNGNQDVVNDIIVREEEVPTNLNYDYTTQTPLQENHDVLVSVQNFERRDYIKTSSLYIPPHYHPDSLSKTYYTLEAELKEFSMYEMTPDSAGNAFNFTAKIFGFDFNDSLRAELRSDIDTIVAYETYVNGTEEMVAYFDGRDKSPGVYGLFLEKVNLEQSSFAPNVFTLLEGGEFEGVVEVEVPAVARVDDGFTAKVLYGNEGLVNGYDYAIVIAFYRDGLGRDSLRSEFRGSENPKLDNPEEDIFLYDTEEISEFEDLLLYSAYIPVVPNGFRGEMFFDVKLDVEDIVWTDAYLWRLPRSEFTVSGRLEHYPFSSYPYQLDSIITAEAGLPHVKSFNNVDCSKTLNFDDMLPRIIKGVKGVAERAWGARSISKDIKDSYTPFVTDSDLVEKYKGAKKGYETYQKFDVPPKDTPFLTEIEDVFNCFGGEDDLPPSNCYDITVGYACEFERFCEIEGRTFKKYINNCATPDPPKREKEPTNNRKSLDPNEIVGPGGITDLRIVPEETKMNYTIYFENMSEASAPAARVRIDNLLAEEMKLQSFRVTGFGFGEKEFLLDPTPSIQQDFDLGPEYNNQILNLVAGLNAPAQKAFWEFTTIDPNTGIATSDPFGGFLLPNDSTGVGQAWLTYEIDLKNDIENGTEVLNQAIIVFDQNEPIETNRWSNLIGDISINTKVSNLPAYSEKQFMVAWDVVESDFTIPVERYNIFVQINDGEITKWKSNTIQKQSEYHGVEGNTYAFYSQGILSNGSKELFHETFDTKTTIQAFALTPDIDNPLYIYPTPANDILYLQYFLSEESEVSIKFFDVIGREIMNLEQGTQSSGIHNYVLNQLPKVSGAFFVELSTKNDRYIQRGMILR